MHPRPLLDLRSLVLWAGLLSAACTGPATILHNPHGHRVFVDGVAVERLAVQEPESDRAVEGQPGAETTEHVLPFRYYGTSRWDAQPADHDGDPDWNRQPASAPIERTPPISPWLFPLDFPLEIARWVIRGRGDLHVPIELPATPPDLLVPVPAEVPPTGLGRLLERCEAARIAR